MRKIIALISTITVLYFSVEGRVFAQHNSHDTSEVHHIHDADDEIAHEMENHHSTGEKEQDYGDVIMHHISDDYVFQIFGSLHFPLPVIIYEKGKGFDIFNSNQLLLQDDNHLS